MKLVSLELGGFRGFAKTQAFDLDADAVILVGANGNGKTSIFDGILWAICGRIPRLASESERFVSLYSETGQARAVLTLRDSKQCIFKITRSFDGTQSRVALETAEGTLAGPSAEGRLIDLLWPEAAAASAPQEALASVVTRGVYLQQDLLRHFVEAATDQERFVCVSELFGSGRVTELQAALERAKKSWSTATNQRGDELQGMRDRFRTVEARARELAARAAQDLPPIAPETWTEWWNTASRLGLKTILPDPASREAPAAIDATIKAIDSLRAAVERRLQILHTVQPQIAALGNRPAVPDLGGLRERDAVIRKQIEDLKRILAEEQSRLAEQRRSQATLKEKSEQLRALASIALKHLDGECPVCAQSFDRAATKQRLEALLGSKDEQAVAATTGDRLNQLLAELSAKEKEAAAAELALRSAQERAAEREATVQSLTARIAELGIEASDDAERTYGIAKGIADANTAIEELVSLQKQGESLALRLAQSAAQGSLVEYRREADTLKKLVDEREKIVATRNRTGEKAQKVIEALREAASTVVEQRLSQLEPILQNIYARIDPHPAFTTVEFLSKIVKGKGLLSTVVKDAVEDKTCPYPSSVLSSSQVNALAVAIFLSFSLGLAQPPLSVVMLDDPLQSLDDVNLLGLVDLLRRAKDRRQLCVSTHDARFANLLARKLRPSDQNGRTIVIELDGWSRQGPSVAIREIKCDPTPARLIAS